MKQVEYNGFLFTRDEKTGYYLSSRKINGHRIRLHRYVWETERGTIPKGYHVHHIDGDKDNNDIDNLQLMAAADHLSFHGVNTTPEQYDEQVMRMDKARTYANEWHASEAGRCWHKEHYQNTKDKLHVKRQFVCQFCGEKYLAEVTGNNRFCSNKCKSAYRYKKGVDNVLRRCVICGKTFTVNKYSKGQTCSRSCRNKLRSCKKREACRI